MIGLPYGEKNYEDMLSRFHTVTACYGQTELLYQYRMSMCWLTIKIKSTWPCRIFSYVPNFVEYKFHANSIKNLAIANRLRVSFINTNRSQNWATSEESRRYVVAFNRFVAVGIWLLQESVRHILASPGYAPGTIAQMSHGWKEDSMLVKNASQHVPIYLQSLHSNSTRKFKSSPF